MARLERSRLARLWSAVALVGALGSAWGAIGCRVAAGNDPNVRDDELPFAGGSVDAAGSSTTLFCGAMLPRSCAVIPSYANDIAPLVARACVPMCHQPGGTSSDRDLTTYAHVAALGISVLTPVYGCVMPPADAGPDAQLTFAERNELVQWIGCGSPDN